MKVFAICRHRLKTDGEGVTTLVGLPGCPLECRYCINQCMLKQSQLVKDYTISELIDALSIDHCYFVYTGGGITFGGGEPLLHDADLLEFAERCPKEWNLTIETSLNVPKEKIEKILEKRFSFVIDIKSMIPEVYHAYTGKENCQVKENLTYLKEKLTPERYTIKVPKIPDYTTENQVKQSVEELEKMGFPRDKIRVFTYQK